MKTLNHILIAAGAALLTVSTSQADEPRANSAAHENTALLSSPRYLEEHPELLRTPSVGRKSHPVSTKRSVETAVNTALVNSPRFREEHPQFRFAPVSEEEAIAEQISETERLRRLMENRALASSPRFREQHPELLRVAPSYDIAPMK